MPALLLALSLGCAKKPLAPTAAIAAPAKAHVGVRVQLDGTGSAPSADLENPSTVPLAFQWTLSAVPAGSVAALDDAAAPKPRFLPDVAGSYRVQLVVRDFAQPSAPVEVEIVAAGDCVPVVSAAIATPAAPNLSQPVALTGTAAAPCNAPSAGVGSDPIVAYRWTIAAAPDGSTAKLIAPGQLNTSFIPDRRGVYDLALQATDALGFKSAAAHVAVVAQACGDNRPSVDSIAYSPISPNLNAPVRLSAQVSDGDIACGLSRSLYYAWSFSSVPKGSKAQLTSRSAQTPSFTPDLAGDYVLSLVVTDNLGRPSPAGTTTVTAAACGAAAPVATASSSAANLATGDAVQLFAAAADADTSPACGMAITYRYAWQIEAAPLASTAQLNDSHMSNPTFVADQPGTYTFSVVVTASTGVASAPSFVTVQAGTCGTLLPAAVIAPLSGAATGVPVSLTATVKDDNSCKTVVPFTYRWTIPTAPAGSTVQLSGADATGASAQSAPSIVPDVAGSYTLQLVVTDALGLSSPPATQTFVVAPCNAPLNASIAAVSGVTGMPVQLQPAGVSDPNNATCPATVGPFTYSWSIVGQPAGAAAQLNNPADAAPSFTPPVSGTYRVQLVVTDVAGNQSPATTGNVVVANCTAPLSVAIAPASGPTGRPIGLSLSALVNPNDPALPGSVCTAPVAPYRYQWSFAALPAGSKATLNNPRSVSPSFVPDVAQPYQVQVVVTDAAGNASPAVQGTVTVANCTAPLTPVISVASKGGTGVPMPLAASPGDPNTDPSCGATAPFSYRWSLVARPAGSAAALNNAASIAPSLTPDKPGTYQVAVAVTDASGNFGTAVSQPIAVADCGAPLTVAIAAASGPTGRPLSLSTSQLIDPNDPSLPGSACTAPVAPYRYQWSFAAIPAGSKATLNNASTVSPSFVPDVAQPYQVRLVVTDAAGNSSPAVLGTVTVANCTAPLTPTISVASGGATGVPLAVKVDPADPNTDPSCGVITPYSYQWTLVSRPAGSAAALNNPVAAQPSFTPDTPGNYQVAIAIADAAGNKGATISAPIVVSNCGAPLSPVIAVAGPRTTLNPLALSVTLSPANPNNTLTCSPTPLTNTYFWSLTAAPSGSTAGLDNPFAAAPSFTPDLPGTYVATARVIDSLGNSGVASLSIVVSGCGNGSGSSLTARAVPSTATPEVGQPTTLSAIVSDTNAAACGNVATAPFSYAWTLAAPAGSKAILAGATSAQASFTPDLAGSYAYGVTVTDALGYQFSTAIQTVVAADCTIAATIDPVAPLKLTFSSVGLAGHGTSACSGIAFTYSWTFDQLPAGSLSSFNNAQAQNPSFVVDVPNGSWIARLTLTDSKTGAKTFATQTITSNPCGSSMPAAAAGISLPFPIAVIAPQPNPAVGSTAQYLPGYQLQLDGTYSQDNSAACTGPMTYAWGVYARPPGSNAEPYPASAAKPSFTPDVQGDYILQLVVSDGRFKSVPTYLRVNVSDPLKDFVAPVTRGVLWNDVEADSTSATKNPSIAYYQLNAAGSFYDLMFIRCTANCSSASPTWTAPQTIEPGAIDATNSELATAQVSLKFLPGTGTPVVAYRYDPTCEMRYALYNGATWQKSTIDYIGPTASGTSNCLGIHGEIQLMFVGASQTVAVAYHSHRNNTPSALYATCAGGCKTTGTGLTWTLQAVDTASNAGHWLTAYVDPISLEPRLAYHREVTGDLWFATCASAAGKRCDQAAGTWTLGQVEAAAGAVTAAGLWNSMALASNGLVGIAYEDVGSNTVRLATCSAACTNKANWAFTTLATLGNGYYFPSLQFDAQNQAHVTYIDIVNQTLRYAIQFGSTNTFQYFDIDHGVDDGHSSFVLTPAGSTHVSYALTTGLKYYPFGD